jgi:hypothetical protein
MRSGIILAATGALCTGPLAALAGFLISNPALHVPPPTPEFHAMVVGGAIAGLILFAIGMVQIVRATP